MSDEHSGPHVGNGTLPSILYHCAPIPLRAGSVIEPGNWGRLIDRYESDNGQVQVNALNEIALEFARQTYAPSKPSRLNCLFVIEDEEGARVYRDAHQPAGLIYKVEPVEAFGPVHIGNYTFPVQTHLGRYVPQTFARFRSYWVDEASENREVLISCAARILGRVG